MVIADSCDSSILTDVTIATQEGFFAKIVKPAAANASGGYSLTLLSHDCLNFLDVDTGGPQ